MKFATIGYAQSESEQAALTALGCDIIVRTDILDGVDQNQLPPPVFAAMQSGPVAFASGYFIEMFGSIDPGSSDFMVEGMAIASALLPNQCLCGNRDLTAKGWEVMLSGSSLYFQGAGAYAKTPDGVIVQGVPFHWRVTRKTGEVLVHVNGTLLAKALVTTPPGSTQPGVIGRRAAGTFPFAGSMYKFGYWNVAPEYSGSTIGVKYFDTPVWGG